MRKIGLWAVLVGGAVAALVPATVGRADRSSVPGQLTMTPLKAVFLPAPNYATKYTFTFTERNHAAKVVITWYLGLRLIDPAGAPAADVPGSGAAFDPLCSNVKFPGGHLMYQAHVGILSSAFKWERLKTTFVWYHGDEGVYPGSGYGCDHRAMGPRGHQGTVSVHLRDSNGWVCNAEFFGTNDGTGSKPTCAYPRGFSARSDVRVAILSEERAITELRKPVHTADEWMSSLRGSEHLLADAIYKVREDGSPLADDAIAHLKEATTSDEAAAQGGKTRAQRIKDIEDGITAKKAALALISKYA